MPVNNTIQLRKGSASTWAATNPILANGEPGFDTTNNILKIGDGINTYSNLPILLNGIYLTPEEIDDRVANLLVGGTGISLSYDDPNNALTINNTNNAGAQLYLWANFR